MFRYHTLKLEEIALVIGHSEEILCIDIIHFPSFSYCFKFHVKYSRAVSKHKMFKNICLKGVTEFSITYNPIKNYRGLSPNYRGGTVGVCSFHRRCGQLPCNLPITHLRFTPRRLQVCLFAHFNKWSIYE